MKKNYYTPLINSYQYISKLLPGNCRYFPTCSEYAKWQFEFNRADRALFASTKRILSCNQLFPGGIDYPVVHYTPPKLLSLAPCKETKIIYWIIPKKENLYYVIKDFNAYPSIRV